MIDLHCHSTCSDGEFTPDILFMKALQANIMMLALTDHDTIDGLRALHEAAQHTPQNILLINGVEFSVRWKKYDIHILGLNFRSDCQDLYNLIETQRMMRQYRAKKIAAKLEAAGLVNAWDKACHIAGHEHITRPHFAKALVDAGMAKDMQHAFQLFLKKGRVAYAQTQWTELNDVVKTICRANGSAIIAHPLKYGLTRTKLHALIQEFKQIGGHALEVVTGCMANEQRNFLASLCERFALFASCGSDFHGQASHTSLGKQSSLPDMCKPVWQQWHTVYSI